MTETTRIPPEAMARYRATAQRRWEQEQAILAERKAHAWEVARQTATMLREQFGATRVVLFGSLAHGNWFTQASDIDLAAWGISCDAYFLAVAYCQDIAMGFSIDLVDMANCRPSLRAAVEAEGIDL